MADALALLSPPVRGRGGAHLCPVENAKRGVPDAPRDLPGAPALDGPVVLAVDLFDPVKRAGRAVKRRGRTGQRLGAGRWDPRRARAVPAAQAGRTRPQPQAARPAHRALDRALREEARRPHVDQGGGPGLESKHDLLGGDDLYARGGERLGAAAGRAFGQLIGRRVAARPRPPRIAVVAQLAGPKLRGRTCFINSHPAGLVGR